MVCKSSRLSVTTCDRSCRTPESLQAANCRSLKIDAGFRPDATVSLSRCPAEHHFHCPAIPNPRELLSSLLTTSLGSSLKRIQYISWAGLIAALPFARYGSRPHSLPREAITRTVGPIVWVNPSRTWYHSSLDRIACCREKH